MPVTIAELLSHPFDATLPGGGGGRETLTGSALDDLFLPGDAGAVILAGAGDDGVVGGAGDDLVWAGQGNDTVFGGDGNDTLNGQKGNNLLFGGIGDDVLNSGDQASTLDGGEGNDTLVARLKNGGAHVLTGGAGADLFAITLPSQTRKVIVTITDFTLGEDSLTVFGQADTVVMNAGISAQNGPGGVRVELGPREALQLDGLSINDLALAYGLAGNDTLAGGAGDDTIQAGAGDDWVRGFDGNDVIDGAAGHDTLVGGNGDDTLAGGIGDDHLVDEAGRAWLDGWTGNDHLSASGSGGDLFGGQGQDVLSVSLAQGGVFRLSGGFDADHFILTGPSQAGQVITTITDFEPGWDRFTAFGVADTALMAAGVEMQNGPGAVRLELGPNEALEFTGLSIARLAAVYDLAGNDTLAGKDGGPDRIAGEGGNDWIRGFGGNDTLWGDAGNDLIEGGDGNDILSGGQHHDTLFGGEGNDSLHGNRGFNMLYGGNGNDLLTSGDDGSQLSGGDGDDVLLASMKRGATHTLFGDAGADTFDIVLTGASAWPGQMVIADFELGVDSVRVEGVALGVHIASAPVTLEDTAWGAWVTLETGEIIKFNGIVLADLLAVL